MTTPPTVTMALLHGAAGGTGTLTDVSGMSTAGSMATLDDGSNIVGTTRADDTDAWILSPSLANGDHTLTVSQWDVAGNFGVAAVSFTLQDAACSAAGTRIRTARGQVTVEALVEGDQVVIASGALRAVRWIGRRAVATARHPRPWDVQPICVAAHAFGPGLPDHTLRLSPGHAVFTNGVLIPVRYLLNAATSR